MALTPAQYTAFITTVDTTVGAIYSMMDPAETSAQWSTEWPMKGSILTLGWTGRMPKARPWFGPRLPYEPAAQTYSVAPIPYELTYQIEQFQLDDSDVNANSIFWRMLPDMAVQWRRQREYELRDLLENSGVQGTNMLQTTNRQVGFDGSNAFSTSHPINFYNQTYNNGNPLFSGGTYCNDFSNGGQTINGTLIGGALTTTGFASLIQYAQAIPDESGETLGVMPDAMMVPTTLQVESNFILKATFFASPSWGAFANLNNTPGLSSQVGAADNQLAKMGVRQIVNRWLRKTARWYLLDTTHTLKPFLWVVREAPRVVPRVNPNDPIVFDQHKYTWGGWDRVCPAWNYSWLFFRSAPTGG